MNANQLNDITSLECGERFDYFMNEVCEKKEIWILVNPEEKFLKIFSEDENFDYLPVWSNADVAKAYTKDSPDSLVPKVIPLPEFFKKWVTGLSKDGLNVGVFPTKSDMTVWIMDPTELKEEISDELASC
jgi:hypothetical protein